MLFSHCESVSPLMSASWFRNLDILLEIVPAILPFYFVKYKNSRPHSFYWSVLVHALIVDALTSLESYSA